MPSLGPAPFRSLRLNGHPVVLAILLASLARPWATASPREFPADAGLVDVTLPPYHARGDDLVDDTAAIQQALLDHPADNRIIYLPRGRYLINGTLRWPGAEAIEDRQRATILQGAGRDETVIQLADYAPGFDNAGRSRPLLWMGEAPSYHYRNAVRDLTLHTGTGNGGATGIRGAFNRQGGIRDVAIIAGGDGTGAVGLDLSHTEAIGPGLIRNLRVLGFEVGIRTGYPFHSLTIENLELSGQRTAGFRNSSQVCSVRGLRSTNQVSAIVNTDSAGFLVLLDSHLEGLPTRRPSPAILNRGYLYVRGLRTPGYTNAIENRATRITAPPGPDVPEFTSHEPLRMFPSPVRSLGLPVKDTPETPWDPPADWAGPQSFGGRANDNRDDTAAIQKAIDSGATTVYLPHGEWMVRGTIEVRGKVRRILGCEARILNEGLRDQPVFRLGPEGAPVVRIERLEVSPGLDTLVEQAAGRTLVLSSCYQAVARFTGPGEVFLEDVSSIRPWTFAGNHVWARQWNVEYEGTKVVNERGQLWAMGFRCEKAGTAIETRAGGRTELLGGLVVSSGGYKLDPMLRLQEASGSFVVAEDSPSSGNPFDILVREVRRGIQLSLPAKGIDPENPLPRRFGGVGLALYTGYDGPGAIPPPVVTNRPAAEAAPGSLKRRP
ncbi:MAG: glycosyl hydrolase family 28-related protein [Verrucomicrobiota bacterium]